MGASIHTDPMPSPVPSSSSVTKARRSSFGKMPDGRTVAAVTLSNARGVSARIIAYGATLQSVIIPDRVGKLEDVAIGYDDFQPYLDKPQYFGSIIGRVANRIAKGRFHFNGQIYNVPVNDGPNSLHGGTTGFDKVLWDVVEVKNGPPASVTLRYVSADGDMGYPGTLTTLATYSLDEANQLTIDYQSTTDAPTVVNLSNHAYWNLAGAGSSRDAMDTMLTIPADRYTPIDATAIPLGRHAPVADTPFDFRKPRAIGDRVRSGKSEQMVLGRGYDHNWVISDAVTTTHHLMARASDPVSGRSFELWSNQPGLQFYSGNFLDGSSVGKGHKILRQGDAFALEPQIFPDAVNQSDYPSVRLDPGRIYRNVMVYKFMVARP